LIAGSFAMFATTRFAFAIVSLLVRRRCGWHGMYNTPTKTQCNTFFKLFLIIFR